MDFITKSDKQSKSSKAAAIDIGSNTIRLLIGRVIDGRLERIESVREVTRLGKGLSSKGVLNSNNVALSIRSLVKLKAICDKYRIGRILAVGTSALREAADAKAFLRLAKDKADIDINIIPGDTEADLTIKGVRWGLAETEANTSCSLVADIGGGSTELILSCDVNAKFSLPLGAVKLFESFIRHDPPSAYELRLLIDHILSELNHPISIIKRKINSRRCNLIATGGTPATIAAIHSRMDSYDGNKVHGMRLPYSGIRSIYEEIISVPLAERRSMTGLESSRADIIIPGTVILLSLMDLIGVNETTVSDYGLMEGILHDVLCRPDGPSGRAHVL